MAFANAEEFYKIAEMLLQKIMKDEVLFAKMKKMNLTLCQKIPNLDAVTTVEWKEPLQYYIGPAPEGVKVDSTTINDDDTYNKFYQGKLNLMMAMTKGQVKSQGNVTAALKFLPMLTPIYKLYVEVLKEAGRDDLIIK